MQYRISYQDYNLFQILPKDFLVNFFASAFGATPDFVLGSSLILLVGLQGYMLCQGLNMYLLYAKEKYALTPSSNALC